MAEGEQSSEDYCALMFRGNKDSTRGIKKKLYLINSQPDVVSVIERCLRQACTRPAAGEKRAIEMN